MNFFFDYIYYRITKAYFKWDGRKGITSIIAIAMIQMVIFLIIVALLSLMFYNTKEISTAPNTVKYVLVLPYFLFSYFAFRKYRNKYNKYKIHWGNETKSVKVFKGIGVVFSLILPWLVLILIIINRDVPAAFLYQRS